MSNTSLTLAIFEAVKSFADTNGLEVKYPGKKFDTPDSGNWLELYLIPNDYDPYLSDAEIISRGMFQLNVGGRPDDSILNQQAIADLIVLQFPKGTIIGDVVVYQTPMTASPVELDDRVLVPVTIRYHS